MACVDPLTPVLRSVDPQLARAWATNPNDPLTLQRAQKVILTRNGSAPNLLAYLLAHCQTVTIEGHQIPRAVVVHQCPSLLAATHFPSKGKVEAFHLALKFLETQTLSPEEIESHLASLFEVAHELKMVDLVRELTRYGLQNRERLPDLVSLAKTYNLIPFLLQPGGPIKRIGERFVEIAVTAPEDAVRIEALLSMPKGLLPIEWHLSISTLKKPETRAAFLKILASPNCPETVELINHSLTAAFSKQIFAALEASKRVKHLFLDQTTLETVKPLVQLLRSSVQLQSLTLEGCLLPEEGLDSLIDALGSQKELEVLFLGELKMNDTQAVALSQKLGLMSRLRNLNLQGNPIGRQGFLALCQSFQSLSQLHTLTLPKNEKLAEKPLPEAFGSHPSLREILMV